MSAYRNRRKSFGKLERPDKIIEREKAQKAAGEEAEKELETPAYNAINSVVSAFRRKK